jgi:agmatinase
MDEKKLNKLREDYGEADGSDYLTERFRHVGEKLADRPHSATKPYAGFPTFLDLPASSDIDGLDVAIIGVPMDLGVTNRSGARFGPRAVRTIERVGPYNHALDEVPRGVLRAADVGDVPMRSRFSLEKSLEDIESYYKSIVAKGVVPLSVGGDHSISYPILKALGEKEPVGMVHIDAHMDTGGAYEGEKFHHGGPFRHAVLAGVLDPERCVQIGIRGSSEFSGEFSYFLCDDRCRRYRPRLYAGNRHAGSWRSHANAGADDAAASKRHEDYRRGCCRGCPPIRCDYEHGARRSAVAV